MNNTHGGNLDAFCAVITDTLKLFDELIEFENKKLDAIAKNDVDLLDQHMKDEQAFLLKMRGLDMKREHQQELLGLSGLAFREIIEKYEGAEKETLRALYESLSEKAVELKTAIAASKKYIDLHISSIGMLLEKLEGTGTYDKNGEKDATIPPGRFTPTKA